MTTSMELEGLDPNIAQVNIPIQFGSAKSNSMSFFLGSLKWVLLVSKESTLRSILLPTRLSIWYGRRLAEASPGMLAEASPSLVTKRYLCTVVEDDKMCGKEHTFTTQLAYHIYLAHKMFLCDRCGTKFHSMVELCAHNHTHQNTIQCEN